MNIRVAVADDHPTMLAGMGLLLSRAAGITVVGMVTDSTQLVDLLGKSACDVVVTDFSMPGGRYGDGLALLRFLKRRFPHIKLVVFTGIENSEVIKGIMDVGASGVVSKADDLGQVETAIRMAQLGGRYLSPLKNSQLAAPAPAAPGNTEQAVKLSKREAEVLRMYAEGLTISEIGARAGRSNKTISAQKVAAMKKLGLKHDADIFRYAQAKGLVQASQIARRNASRDDSDV
ncbi:response regulator transcription factor [Dyella sp. 7MK23]|uniref:Response regulator transcription factor n=1 Tax=Dyella acidiphila TaxID=2775866 RepID=A0ABR9GAG3_9GAMM|nr:response regulator transcription factor [Dyella acidiphila]